MVRRIEAPAAARCQPRVIEVIEATGITEPPPLGQISAISGQAAFAAIVAAIAAAKSAAVSGIVTAPINKEAMASAGIRYPGHTEILADYGGAKRVAMMLANDDIRTVLVTIHTSLRKPGKHLSPIRKKNLATASVGNIEGQINNLQFRLAKFEGSSPWSFRQHEDELFFVHRDAC